MNKEFFTPPEEFIEEPEIDVIFPEESNESQEEKTAHTTEKETKTSVNNLPNITHEEPYVLEIVKFMRQYSSSKIDLHDELVLGLAFLAKHIQGINQDTFLKFDQATLQTQKFLTVIEDKKQLLLAEIMEKHKQALDFDIQYLNEKNYAHWSEKIDRLQHWVKWALFSSLGATVVSLVTLFSVR